MRLFLTPGSRCWQSLTALNASPTQWGEKNLLESWVHCGGTDDQVID